MTYVLYHANCLDGKMSAAIAYSVFRDRATYIPVNYQQPLPELEPNRQVFILDFSYPREIILKLKQTNEVVILDHHKTAQEQLLGISGAIFDMSKSGAVLTWEYFYPGKPVPNPIQLVQDRDLWQWQYKNTKPFTNGLWHYLDKELYQWADIFLTGKAFGGILELGLTIEELNKKEIERQLKLMYWDKLPLLKINDKRDLVPHINTNHLISETAEAMYKAFPEAPYVIIWYQSDIDIVRYSLRASKDNDVDVSAIAKLYGGGGHPKAAGFTFSLE